MAKSFQERQEQKNQHLAKLSEIGRDIAPLPKVKHPKRKAACRYDLKRFCETYHKRIFFRDWSDDHLTVISILQDAVLNGGLFAVAMPRGYGKTTLTTCAAEWALLYGHRRFVVIFGASESKAKDILENIRVDFTANDELAADFPEVCYPLQRLENIVSKAKGQLLKGKNTLIELTKNQIRLPTVDGSAASGAIVRVSGITGSCRGLSVMNPSDGKKYRPDFAMIDDPQDRESANSPKQIEDRKRTIQGDVLGLAGIGKRIACVMPVTVIAKGDVADQMLDRKKFPQWQGIRTKMLRSLPTDTKLWEQYAEIRASGQREGKGTAAATAFYVANREAMDAGGEASWNGCHETDEASAIQCAVNKRLDYGEEAFAAEYQNEPLSTEEITPLMLTADQVAAKVINLARGIVPATATKLTAFIDVQGSVLYYVVCAFGNDFTGHVVDYGCYPDQKRSYFFLKDASPTFADVSKGLSLEAQILRGVETLAGRLIATEWRKEGGGHMRISRVLVDSGYKKDSVVQACRMSAITVPSKGYGIQANQKPMDDWADKDGERKGWNWRLRSGMPLTYDTNSWKTFVALRLMSAAGDEGNLSLFDPAPNSHKMFCDHATSEYFVTTEGYGRTVHAWDLRVGRESHWYDCLIGCFVAASEQGILSVGQGTADKPKGRRRKVQVNF